MKREYVWLGVRESDICHTNNLFTKSITVLGSGQNGNLSMEQHLNKRINHNGLCEGYESFFQESMHNILSENPNSIFIHYDSADGENFSRELKDKIYYSNNPKIVDFLNNKITSKIWAENYIKVLPFKVLSSSNCTKDFLSSSFKNCSSVVIQQEHSCGGSGTFVVDLDSNVDINLPLCSQENCIVTEFKENNVSVNIHAVIYENDILLFPPSIQIVEQKNKRLEYAGSDFSAYKFISQDQRNKVSDAAQTLCKELQKMGYLGICGIDFILADNDCYFMEVNPRFQASTALLNQSLSESNYPSLQEYHIDVFENTSSTLPRPPAFSNGSLIVYQYEKNKKSELKWMHDMLNHSSEFTVCDDSLSWDKEIEDGSYLFQLRSREAISSITYQNSLRIQPNLKISKFDLTNSNEFYNLLCLKILLLSRGINITKLAWSTIVNSDGADYEEFGAITIFVAKKFWVTVPCFEKWHELSPLVLDYDSIKCSFIVSYYSNPLFEVEIMPEDTKANQLTKSGYKVKDIVYLNPDRLRVYHRNGCALQDAGKGCMFCDLFGVKENFTFQDVCEALDYYKNDSRVCHYLIGGGSESSSAQCTNILNIAEHLQKSTNKSIYLMSQPINDINLLKELYSKGISEVAFNIEMFDAELAKRIMPGKALNNSLNKYYDSLKKAVSIWGNTGNVRSVILIGFDDLKQFSKGIRQLCELGVSPILSLFRPCYGTELEKYISFNEEDTLLYYKTATEICKEYGIKLGPTCKACQNNTVTLEI
ncbi:MAG: ATP-grasp domain-containing protein [Clostridia bacterium]|nr:ATP-grasp domain-containing protein [Clostridia bacterium]